MNTSACAKRFLPLVLVCYALLTNAAGQNSAFITVRGTVTDPTGAVIFLAKVNLVSADTGYDRTVKTDEEGRFRFTEVPNKAFRLQVEAPGFQAADFQGDAGKRASVFFMIQFKGATADIQQITVTDSLPGSSISSAQVDFDEDELERRPLQSPNRDITAVVESVPGVVPEENGRMHLRGAEAQPQYVLDGVPLAENLSNSFATAPDIENLRATEVITGNLPAEYGERTAGVINLTTRSGLEMPWTSSISFSAGSFDSRAVDIEFGGHVKNVGIFVTADASGTNRFLDPPETANFNNNGGLAHLFARFDWSPSARDALHLSLAMGGSGFRVPNLAEQQEEGQNLRQELRDDYEALNWTHTFSSQTTTDVSLFRRSASARLLDPFTTGTPFFLTQSRRQRSEGFRASVSREWKRHSLKAGAEFRQVPLSEQFILAVTDPEEIEDEDPTAKVLAYTLNNPFFFGQQRTGILSSTFLQDRVKLNSRLTLDLGLRLDHPDLIVHGTEWSPRIGLAYHIARTNTTLHGSYNRLIGVPALENLLLASSQQGKLLEHAAEEGDDESSRVLRLERQNQYQFGFRQQVGGKFDFGVLHYVKNIDESLDDEQLFQTAIVFPVALARADVRGTEIRLEVKPWSGWKGYVSYANARATVTAPIVGGLLLTKEDEFNEPGRQFPADSDERNEAQLGVTYSHKSGMWGSFDTRYDSGIPANLEDVDFSSLDPGIQKQLDPARSRIKPRTLMNFAAGGELFRESKHPVSLQIGVNNLLDRFYLYNFHSIFSGTHIGRPREVIARVTLRWGKR